MKTAASKYLPLLATAVLATPALAGTPAPVAAPPVPAADAGWTFRSAPYLWAQGLDGTMGVLGLEGNVDLSFGDILSDLDFAFMGMFEARHGRLGIMADLNYAETSSILGARDILFTGGDFKMKQFLGNVTLSWRVVETPTTTVDLYGGARINWVDIGIGMNTVAGGRISRSGDETWVDAIAGIRFQTSLGGPWFLRGVGDIGGGSSDLTWQAMGLIGYNINDSTSIGLGYRALSTDYENGGFTYDITASGPMLGLEKRF